MDIEPDRLSGRRTTATLIGAGAFEAAHRGVFVRRDSCWFTFCLEIWSSPGFLGFGAVWFVLDALLIWKNRPYSPGDAFVYVGLERGLLCGDVLELVCGQLDARAARRGNLSMQKRFLLEISVESVEAAMAAERGGAQRIEFCSNAREGGTTPSGELMRAVRERVGVPIFSMVRPRGGNFFYTDAEFEVMRRDIDAAKEFRMDGVVLGLLDADGHVDIARTKELVDRARPLPVTFHRAFDECVDLREALEDVIKTGSGAAADLGRKADGTGGVGSARGAGSNRGRAADL